MKILLAVDGSEYSESAARFLTFLNLSPVDEITVFHALQWSHFLYTSKSFREAIKEFRKLFAPGIVDSVLEILKPVKAKISTAIIEGAAKQSIVEKAAEAGMDLIVMGSRGITGIESLLLGSVTRAVAIKSTVPVLATKLPLSVKPGGMKILFATDGSDYSMSTQEFLSSMPFPDDSEITVLNVTPPILSDIPLTVVPEIRERYIKIAETAMESERMKSGRVVDLAKTYLSRRFENIKVLSKEGSPSAQILAISENLRSDLIAVGCRGLTGIKGMMGSVSRNILSHSTCSVLIGKMCND